MIIMDTQTLTSLFFVLLRKIYTGYNYILHYPVLLQLSFMRLSGPSGAGQISALIWCLITSLKKACKVNQLSLKACRHYQLPLDMRERCSVNISNVFCNSPALYNCR